MKFNISSLFKNFDWIAFINLLIMVSFSLIMLYSISLGSDDPVDMVNFKKQIVFVVIGIILYFVFAYFIDYRALNNASSILYILGFVTLILVLFFGSNIRGTTGWFDFGFFSVQPVELIKVVLIIFLAKFFSLKGKYLHLLKYLILSFVGVLGYLLLVLMQPDFGSTIILFSLWIGLVLLTGIKKSHFIALVLGLVSIATALWFFVFEEYQKNRVRVFLNPSLDPLGTGYNVTQAIIAVGSGGLLGRGLSFGSQSKLKFLPESQTDFIFSVISEQLGLLGGLAVLLLFVILFWRLFETVRNSKDNFGRYLVLGTIIVIFTQVVINIGMNIGLMPVTGITLPLISYGGSSLLSTMIMLGITQSVYLRSK